MLEAFCCATPENIAPLTVAVSSFRHHNPDVPMTVFSHGDTDLDPLTTLGLSVRRVVSSCLMISALDHLLSMSNASRVVHVGANTLTQDRLADLGEVNMDTVTLGVTGVWTFAASEEMLGWYALEDEALHRRRLSINPRYFDTDFLLINLAYLRQRPSVSLTMDFIKGPMESESDYLNSLFRNDKYLTMPPNLNLASEPDVAHYLPTRVLANHRIALGEARVARFPGKVTPWHRIAKFDRQSMQLPMAEYLEAVERVESLLPSDFVAVVRGNYDKCESYLGDLPWVMRDIRELKSDP